MKRKQIGKQNILFHKKGYLIRFWNLLSRIGKRLFKKFSFVLGLSYGGLFFSEEFKEFEKKYDSK